MTVGGIGIYPFVLTEEGGVRVEVTKVKGPNANRMLPLFYTQQPILSTLSDDRRLALSFFIIPEALVEKSYPT